MKPEKWQDAHSYLAGEIAECADELEKNLKGYPAKINKTAKSSKSGYSRQKEKQWRKTLLAIRDGFRIWKELHGNFREWKNGKVPPDEKFTKHPKGYWIIPPVPRGYKYIVNKKKKKKFKEAMRLFALHFEKLWG